MVSEVNDAADELEPTFAGRDVTDPVPKNKLAATGMSARTAYQLCSDELTLDGTPILNLASFVTTWMEPEAEALIQKCLNKNLVDRDEYPQAREIEQRCVSIIADLFSDKDKTAIGTATVGSSEAVMLAGLALKWRWRAKNSNSKCQPNLVMGSNVQVVWEKFARYFEVEPRYIEITPEQTTITPAQVQQVVDENTIGVVAILGVTFTGEYEPIAEIAAALDALQQEKSWDIPLHVDAASGGFVAPFAQPDLEWDFRVKRVVSINVSGHKYGLVYPGVGWVLWRNKDYLPEELIFKVNYLGGEMPTFNLNFSRPSAFVVAQYYNFLRLGRKGYSKIINNLLLLSATLKQGLEQMQCFEFLSQDNSLPVIVVKLNHAAKIDVFDLSERLRVYGWIVPAYTLPKAAEKVAVLRFVLREGMARDMVDKLLQDLQTCLQSDAGKTGTGKTGTGKTGTGKTGTGKTGINKNDSSRHRAC